MRAPRPIPPVDDAIAAVLRGDAGAIGRLERFAAAEVLAAAETHGVSGLLRRELVRGSSVSASLADTMASLDRQVRADAILGVWRRDQCRRMFVALREARVSSLVFKGDALAHTLYDAPYLRPRCDTDLLVRKADMARVTDILTSLGYEATAMVDREFVHTQRAFARRDGARVHYVDLHWAISSRPLFAGMATFEELLHGAQPVEALGDGAAAPSPVWSLLLACIHRVAHHDDSQRLVWLQDIKILADQLSRDEWIRFWMLARQREIVDVCRTGLMLADARLRCAVAAGQVRESASKANRRELSAAFLGGGMSKVRMVALDLRAVRGLRAKTRLVASHLFPDAAYMNEAFGATGGAGLVTAYVRRATHGLRRVMTSNGGIS